MARQPDRSDHHHAPLRRVVRLTVIACVAGALALIGADWAGVLGPAGASALPAALVLGLWACLLSAVLLAVRLRG